MWCSYHTNIVDYAELVEFCFGKVFVLHKTILKLCVGGRDFLELLVYFLSVWSAGFLLDYQYILSLYVFY